MEDSTFTGAGLEAIPMPALSSAAQQGSTAKHEPRSPADGTVEVKKPVNLTGRLCEPEQASEDDYVGTLPRSKAAAKKPLCCQVDGCGVDLSQARKYFQRYRVCERHLKAPSLQMDGRSVRFCDQCSKFHEVSMFEGNRRTCNEKLERTRQARSDKRRQLNEQAMRAQGRWRSRAHSVPNIKRPYDGSYMYDDCNDEDYELEANGFALSKRHRLLPAITAPPLARSPTLASLPEHRNTQVIPTVHRAAVAVDDGHDGGNDGISTLVVSRFAAGAGAKYSGASSLSSLDDGHTQLQLFRMDSIPSRPGEPARGSPYVRAGKAATAAAGYDPLRMQQQQLPGASGGGTTLAQRALAVGQDGNVAMKHEVALLKGLYDVVDGQQTAAPHGTSGEARQLRVSSMPVLSGSAFGHTILTGGVALASTAQTKLIALLERQQQQPLGEAAGLAVRGQVTGGGGGGSASLRGAQLQRLQAATASTAEAGVGRQGLAPGIQINLNGGARQTLAEEDKLYSAATATAERDSLMQDTEAARVLRAATVVATAMANTCSGGGGSGRIRDNEQQKAHDDAVAAAEVLLARLSSGGCGPGAVAVHRAAAGQRSGGAAADGRTLLPYEAVAAGGTGGARTAAGRSMPVLDLGDTAGNNQRRSCNAPASPSFVLLSGSSSGSTYAVDEAARQLRRVQQEIQEHLREQSGKTLDTGSSNGLVATAVGKDCRQGLPPPPQQQQLLQQEQEKQALVRLAERAFSQQQRQQQQQQRQQQLQRQQQQQWEQSPQQQMSAALLAQELQEQLQIQQLLTGLASRGDRAASDLLQQQLQHGDAGAVGPRLGLEAVLCGLRKRSDGLFGHAHRHQHQQEYSTSRPLPSDGPPAARREGYDHFELLHLRRLQEQLDHLGVQVVLQ